MNWLERFYLWFWFHTEFWLTHKDRRPYTFIMQDWIYTHRPAAGVMMLAWFTFIVVFSFWHGTTSTILGILTAMLMAHLVWGVPWIEHQQEFPEYLGGVI